MLNNQWIIGIATSLIAALVFSLLITLISARFRIALLRVLLHLAGAGVYEYFRTQNAATDAIGKSCKRAKDVRILAVRAWSLFPVASPESQLADLIKEKGTDCTLKILLLSPLVTETGSGVAFIDKRAAEVNKIYDQEIRLRDQVALTIDHICALKRAGVNCTLKLYNEMAVFKLLLLDDSAFVGGFNRANVGHNNPVYHVRRNEGVLFDLADRYFNYIWDFRSVEYNIDQSAVNTVRGLGAHVAGLHE